TARQLQYIWHATFKEEHVEYADYADFDDALRQIAHWLTIVYNTQRIHSALRYATPAEAEAVQPSRQSLSLVRFLSKILTALHAADYVVDDFVPDQDLKRVGPCIGTHFQSDHRFIV